MSLKNGEYFIVLMVKFKYHIVNISILMQRTKSCVKYGFIVECFCEEKNNICNGVAYIYSNFVAVNVQ